MHRIVFLDRYSLIANVRPPAFAHAWQDHAATAEHEVVERLRGATVAITNKVPLRAAAIARLPDLKMVAIAATGSDNVDLAACRERGIVVSNIRNYSTVSVPEHCFALLLALRRNLRAYIATGIACSVGDSRPYFGNPPNITVTGYPVRRELYQLDRRASRAAATVPPGH